MQFKASLLLTFESENIKNARAKLKEILNQIVEETIASSVTVSEEDKLFDDEM
jgi:hypothetical protein